MERTTHDPAVTTFLVERYWPGVSQADLAAAVLRTRRSAATMRCEGHQVDFVRSTFVPEQETVLCLFEAETLELVTELNDRAEFPYDRIAEAVAIVVSDSRPEDA